MTWRLADERAVLFAYMRSSASCRAWLSVLASDGSHTLPSEQPTCQPLPVSVSASRVSLSNGTDAFGVVRASTQNSSPPMR